MRASFLRPDLPWCRALLLGAGALPAAGAAPALAQTEIVAPPTPNADKLAEQMRVLAADPRDMEALLTAGELSARLNDPAAAMAFFLRAEAVDAANPRIAAGRAMVLVRAERPGEALKLFAEAERHGANMRNYAPDRAFAYDLMGAPRLAQRDYKIAMTQSPSDETVRHYALSLGISGDRDAALALLDPLLRRGDRAAWRARAFVLAMNGDVPGAEKIAANMMPGNMGQELLPFFRRLQQLSPADRAFAVHFGELSPTPARIADARRAPPLPVLAPEPTQVAQAAAPAPVARGRDRTERRESHRRRGRRDDAQVAAAVPVPEPSAPATPEPAVAPPVAAAPEPVRSEAPQVAPAPVAPSPRPAARPSQRVGREDSVLASIISGITIPASELGVAPLPGDAPPSAPVVAAPAPPPVAAPVKAEPPREKPKAQPKPKPKPKPDPAKLEPARIWVQVAGGANEATLPREWARLAKAAPEAFRRRDAWSTPLRATNRLLTGPFKSEDEAQDFVNRLAGEGLSAFVFTSEAGQKVTKLSVK